jgi:hypothetical protein
VKEQSSTCLCWERTMFNSLEVYIGWSWFRVSSFCLGFWVSIRITMCATCIVHILCFTLHMLRSWKNLMIFEAIDFALVVGYGFWIVNSLHFFVWFLHYLVPIFALCIIYSSCWFKLWVLHWPFHFWVLHSLHFGLWVLDSRVFKL